MAGTRHLIRLPFTIAIDGPAGAGKSTIARRVAAALQLTYIDTGAMYRAVAYRALESKLDTTDDRAMATLAGELPLRLSPLSIDLQQQVWIGDQDVTGSIRTPEVSNLTSQVSALSAVRRVIVEQQRRLGATDPRGVVLEGRDIGSVVFPDAPLKIFLTASPQERARRRVRELEERGMLVDYDQILADQIERDTRDSSRADSPLLATPDAHGLDTDGRSIESVVQEIVGMAVEREPELG